MKRKKFLQNLSNMIKFILLALVIVLLYLYIKLDRRVKFLESVYKDIKLDKEIAKAKHIQQQRQQIVNSFNDKI